MELPILISYALPVTLLGLWAILGKRKAENPVLILGAAGISVLALGWAIGTDGIVARTGPAMLVVLFESALTGVGLLTLLLMLVYGLSPVHEAKTTKAPTIIIRILGTYGVVLSLILYLFLMTRQSELAISGPAMLTIVGILGLVLVILAMAVIGLGVLVILGQSRPIKFVVALGGGGVILASTAVLWRLAEAAMWPVAGSDIGIRGLLNLPVGLLIAMAVVGLYQARHSGVTSSGTAVRQEPEGEKKPLTLRGSIIAWFLSLFTGYKVAGSNREQYPGQRLILYVFKLITNKEIVREEMALVTSLDQLSDPDRLNLTVQLYLRLEKLILRSVPRITKGQFSRESLHDDIGRHVSLDELPEELRLIFYPKSRQLVSLFELGLREMVVFIIAKIGSQMIDSLFTEIKGLVPLKDIKVTQRGLDFTALNNNLMAYVLDDVITAFRKLYQGFYNTIEGRFGVDMANSVIKVSYHHINRMYGPELSGQYLNVVPDDALKDERMQEMSHETLEFKIKERTSLLEHTSIELENQVRGYEEKNRELETTKQAMMNLLEDAQELEEKLKTERDRATAIVTTIGEGVVVVGSDNSVQFINPTAVTLLELPQASLVGAVWHDLIAVLKEGQPVPKGQWPVDEALRLGKRVIISVADNYSYRLPSGKIIPVTISTTPILKGPDVTGATIVFRDATAEVNSRQIIEKEVADRTAELKEKNRALEDAQVKISEGWIMLQKEKARLSASINSLHLGYIMTDSQGKIIVTNPFVRDILNITSDVTDLDELRRHLVRDIDLRNLHRECLKVKHVIDLKNIHYADKYISVHVTPIMMENSQEVIGTVILVRNVTEAKVLERSRDEFFSIASHELRTPLTSIRGNTSMMLDYFADVLKDPQLHEMVDDIHTSSIRLIDIVSDFLDTSRLELKKTEFKKEVIPLESLVTRTFKEFEGAAHEKGNQLVFNKPDGILPNALADTNRVKQVLINLIGNSMKFTANGRITLSVKPDTQMVEIDITDTGSGIPKNNTNLLFRKFQQAESNILTRDMTKGTGLGLYISKLLVEGMGGRIWLVTSEQGMGSTFAFTLPVAAG